MGSPSSSVLDLLSIQQGGVDGAKFTLLPGERLLGTAKNVAHLCPFSSPTFGTLYLTTWRVIFENAEDKNPSDPYLDHKAISATKWKGNNNHFQITSTATATATTTDKDKDKEKEKDRSGSLNNNNNNNNANNINVIGQNVFQTELLSNPAIAGGPEIPLGLIVKVEKVGGQSNRKENAYGIDIICSDFRTLRFGFIPENHPRKAFYEQLMIWAFPLSNNQELAAFSFSEKYEINGWELYEHHRELNRIMRTNFEWRISTQNSSYGLCNTYPSVLGVPAKINDNTLEDVAKFRTRGRFPALSWLHPTTKASITRSSQPKVGPWRRNEQDEAMIEAIRIANPDNLQAKLYIVDARPKVNAVANQAKGAGYESTGVYENTELLFMNIPNIHVIRDSLRKLRDCCCPQVEDEHWHARVEESNWLEYVRLILETTARMVELVDRDKISVLVHCSDGWDRTPQITALAMLLMDPFYRTIKGFAILLEKEWVAFGHKFAQRVGHGNKDSGDEQRAPIFIQFLDCVFQLTVQHPCSFEFNEALLITLADEVYACRFGTFLFNCEQLRVEAQVKERTVSLWSYVLSRTNAFKNPFYQECTTPIYPIYAAKKMQVWTNYYLRWNPHFKKSESENQRQRDLILLVENLRKKVSDLEGLAK